MPTTTPTEHRDTPWHALPASAIAERLATDARYGLPHAEAARRPARLGLKD